MNKINRKLRSNSGESMAETLISLLVAALGILLLAGMIQASSNLIVSSNEKFRKYVEDENIIIEKDEDEKLGDGQVSLTSGDIAIRFNREETGAAIDIEYFEKTLGKKKIISFRKK